jgi:putative SOS response-associated peptidase YedK
MCFHNSLTKKPKKVAKHYNVQVDEDLHEEIYHGNGFTFLNWPIVSMNQPDRLTLKHWGLVPPWVKNDAEMKKMRSFNLNAKQETVFEKPSFKYGIQYQRCLVPSTGFFEWREINKKKIPYFISLKDTSIFSLAGIASTWIDPNSGKHMDTFAILTTEANEVMEMIHNTKKRMPVILNREDEFKWLNPLNQESDIHELCKPIDAERLAYFTIQHLISSRTQDTNVSEVLNGFNYPELNTLF